MKKIAILGSTGSIGTQTLDIVREQGDIQVVAMAAGSNISLLEAQMREFKPSLVSVWDEKKASELRTNTKDLGIKIVSGMEGLLEVSVDVYKRQPPATGISEEENLAGDGDIHKVYLTFEDGPSDHTGEILDILAQYDVKATFFVVGKEDEESQALYQRIADEGHTLGMHSYSNKYSQIYQSDEAFEEDFERLRDELYQVTGVNSIYYRFPGGSSNQISNVPMSDFIHYLNEQGVIYYDWNVSAGDAASNAYSSEEIVANVMDDVVKYKTSVVLLHDASDKSATVEALAPLIEALNEMGAEILPIDEDTSVIQYVKADSID